jgi:hypothetical protein
MAFESGGECRECGHPSAAHAGGGCRRCTCPGFTGERGAARAVPPARPREALAAYVGGVLRDEELARFVTAVAGVHRVALGGGDRRATVRALVAALPEETCAAYLAELRRREQLGLPLVR